MDNYQPIALALVDSANECEHDDAVATLTLRSGREFTGKLQKPISGSATAHLRLPDGGWATVLIGEIAGVASNPAPRRVRDSLRR